MTEPTAPEPLDPDLAAAASGDQPEGDETPPDVSHSWVAGNMTELTDEQARLANRYQSYWITKPTKIDVLDLWCSACRKSYRDVKSLAGLSECEAAQGNTHLIGGNQSERKKRKLANVPKNSMLFPPARMSRQGIDAVIDGTA